MSSTSRPPLDAPRFDLSGGEACLDLANTWSDRARVTTDKLVSYGALVALAVQREDLDRRAARRLLRKAEAAPEAARRAFAEARALRDACYAIFAAAAAGERPPVRALEQLNAALALALPHLRLEWAGERAGWRWEAVDGELRSPLWVAALSAADLLTSRRLDRVRECDGGTCTWLFVDRSRNRSRRWCDMASCGNRAKARRHYRRTHGSGSAEGA